MAIGLWPIPNRFTPGNSSNAFNIPPSDPQFHRPDWGLFDNPGVYFLKLLPSLDVAEGTSRILPGTVREKSIASIATHVPNYGSSAIRADHNDFPFPSGQ